MTTRRSTSEAGIVVQQNDPEVRSTSLVAISVQQNDPEVRSSSTVLIVALELGADHTITADPASILVTSYDASLTPNNVLGADQASIHLTGYDATLRAAITLTADQGAIEVTGQQVGLTAEMVISLTWTDNSEHEDGFTIERQTDGGAWTTVVTGLAPDTESYEEKMETGHTYNYRVKAESATLGDSEWSNEDDITI